jgi:ABC-2 type transport system ATP-binding protein
MIEIQNLSKHIGKTIAIDDISLNIASGASIAFVGGTNAGKSVLLALLATVIAPTRGDAWIDQASIVRDALRVKQLVGYLPERVGVYPDLTCADYVSFFARCQGIGDTESAQLAADLLQVVDLYHRKNDFTDRLTPGQTRRLGLARALAHDPSVLLLDEPMTGLDPRARVELRESLRELNSMGKTLVATANNLAEIDDFCEMAVMLERGRVVEVIDLSSEKARPRVISVKYLGDVDLAEHIVRGKDGVIDVIQSSHTALSTISLLKEMRITFDGSYIQASALMRSLTHSAVQVVAFGEMN